VFTAPPETLKFVALNEATPFIAVVASTPAIVNIPPKDTGDPDTEIPVPAVGVTVIDAFVNEELPIFDSVLLKPEIVLFDKISELDAVIKP